jgi:hypothetical protein
MIEKLNLGKYRREMRETTEKAWSKNAEPD